MREELILAWINIQERKDRYNTSIPGVKKSRYNDQVWLALDDNAENLEKVMTLVERQEARRRHYENLDLG